MSVSGLGSGPLFSWVQWLNKDPALINSLPSLGTSQIPKMQPGIEMKQRENKWLAITISGLVTFIGMIGIYLSVKPFTDSELSAVFLAVFLTTFLIVGFGHRIAKKITGEDVEETFFKPFNLNR